MQVEITLDSGRGETILLPEEFGLEPEEIPYHTASVEIPGRPGEYEYRSARRLGVRTLRASAILEGATRDQADTLADDLRARLIGGPLWIRREAGAERFIVATCASVSTDPHRGYHERRLRTVTAQFTALRPYWRGNVQVASRSVTASPTTWTVIQPGTAPIQVPVVRITATEQVVNPALEHAGTGARLWFRGVLLAGQSLVARAEPNLAYRGLVSLATVQSLWGVTYAEDEAAEPVSGAEPVIHQMGAEWLDDGFWLVPGENAITYRDDAASSHRAVVEITWRPMYV